MTSYEIPQNVGWGFELHIAMPIDIGDSIVFHIGCNPMCDVF